MWNNFFFEIIFIIYNAFFSPANLSLKSEFFFYFFLLIKFYSITRIFLFIYICFNLPTYFCLFPIYFSETSHRLPINLWRPERKQKGDLLLDEQEPQGGLSTSPVVVRSGKDITDKFKWST
jgi:hypothetical protein